MATADRGAVTSGEGVSPGDAAAGTGSRVVRVVLVSLPDAGAARALARTLVEERLAACGSVVPGATSIYRWEGELLEEPEVLLFLKTTEAALPELLRRVPELHAYDVPEILALPVSEGHPPYMAWVTESTGR
jgi:periplasmic divalent cation tolerance protein